MPDFIIRVNKKHYPQTLLEECKFGIKKAKWRIILMMILNQVHLMNVTMKLIIKQIMKLIMKLIMSLMINLLKNKDCILISWI